MAAAFEEHELFNRAQSDGPRPKMVRAEQLTNLQDSATLQLPPDRLPGVPEFVPARGLAGAHRQTILASVFPSRPQLANTVPRRVRLPDGAHVILHDNCPRDWQRGDHTAILLHGLAGCHQSGYMVRTARILQDRGVRVFRLDHRNCGAGEGLSQLPYHAGRTEDVEGVLDFVSRICPGSPVSMAGFSLSGNLLLKYLGEDPDRVPLCLYRAVAVCPPVDLKRCVESLGQTRTGLSYDRYFTRRLLDQLVGSPAWRDDLPLAKMKRTPSRVVDFDELFTAPASGFQSGEHYYFECSALHDIPRIRVHTTILAAEDDPLVPSEPLQSADRPPNVTLCLTKRGGHLGFIGRRGVDPTRRWMDWRVADWLLY